MENDTRPSPNMHEHGALNSPTCSRARHLRNLHRGNARLDLLPRLRRDGVRQYDTAQAAESCGHDGRPRCWLGVRLTAHTPRRLRASISSHVVWRGRRKRAPSRIDPGANLPLYDPAPVAEFSLARTTAPFRRRLRRRGPRSDRQANRLVASTRGRVQALAHGHMCPRPARSPRTS